MVDFDKPVGPPAYPPGHPVYGPPPGYPAFLGPAGPPSQMPSTNVGWAIGAV